jgi:hypothetical protein
MPTCPQCSSVLSGNPSVCEFCKFPIGAKDPFDVVAEELQRQFVVPGLWTRAYSEAGGDEARARAFYIRYRAAQLTPNPPRTSQVTPAPEPPAQPFTSRDFGTAWTWAWAIAFIILTISAVLGSVIFLFQARFGVLALYVPLTALIWWAARSLFRRGVVRLQERRASGMYFFVEVVFMLLLVAGFAAISSETIQDRVGTIATGFFLVFITYGVVHVLRSKRLKQSTMFPEYQQRRVAAAQARQNTSAAFHRSIYGLLAFVCGALTLFFGLGIFMLFSSEKVGSGIFMLVLAVLFGFATRKFTKSAKDYGRNA